MPRAISKGRQVDEDLLVQKIKLVPLLYDATHEKAGDTAMMKTVWENNAEELEAPVETCKKVWNRLKDDHLKVNKSKEVLSDRRKSLRSCSSEKNLAFLDASSVDGSNENSRASSNCGSPKGDEKRRLRSSSRSLSRLGAISETDLASLASSSADTIVSKEKTRGKSGTRSAGRTPRKPLNFSDLQPGEHNEKYGPITAQQAERNLRSHVPDPSHLPTKEILQSAANLTPRRQSGSGPNGRNGRMKKSPNPSDSTRAFFDSMAMTVSTFPQHLQAAMKIHICKFISETEFSPKAPTLSDISELSRDRELPVSRLKRASPSAQRQDSNLSSESNGIYVGDTFFLFIFSSIIFFRCS